MKLTILSWLLIITFSIVYVVSADATEMLSDSVRTDTCIVTNAVENSYNPHQLNYKRLLLPMTLVGVGVWGVGNDWMEHINRQVKEEMQENIDKKFTYDDYMQFVPVATSYVLDWCGVKVYHNLHERTLLLAMSASIMAAVTNGMKYSFREIRPDGSARNSFPSGHTATAFMGAELLRMEYRHVSPWIGYAGYAVAAGVGFFRAYNNRHWLNDIIAGAGVGIMSVRLAYWLYPKIFKDKSCIRRNNRPHISAVPLLYGGAVGGVMVYITF